MPRRLTRCVQHEINNLPYLAFQEDAEIRTKRGERQYKCAECGLYQWPRPASSSRPENDVPAVHLGGDDA